MNALALAGRQTRFELRSFTRNRAGVIFAFLFPIMFLVIFSLGGSTRSEEFKGGNIPFLQFFVGGILAYGLIGATFTNLAMRVVNLRESGVLKRVKGTPLPTSSYIGGQIGASLIIAVVLAMVTLGVAHFAYGTDTYAHTFLALLATLAVGAMCFCALGLAMTIVIPNADSAPAIVNFTFLPLAFVSDIFYSMSGAPDWLTKLASFFPVKHLANALQTVFDPRTTGAGFSGNDLLVMALWATAATVFCLRKFKWDNEKASS